MSVDDTMGEATDYSVMPGDIWRFGSGDLLVTEGTPDAKYATVYPIKPSDDRRRWVRDESRAIDELCPAGWLREHGQRLCRGARIAWDGPAIYEIDAFAPRLFDRTEQ